MRYDFEDIHSNRTLRNQFYWAADTHSDWVEWTKRLVELAEEASAVVTVEIASRQE